MNSGDWVLLIIASLSITANVLGYLWFQMKTDMLVKALSWCRHRIPEYYQSEFDLRIKGEFE